MGKSSSSSSDSSDDEWKHLGKHQKKQMKKYKKQLRKGRIPIGTPPPIAGYGAMYMSGYPAGAEGDEPPCDEAPPTVPEDADGAGPPSEKCEEGQEDHRSSPPPEEAEEPEKEEEDKKEEEKEEEDKEEEEKEEEKHEDSEVDKATDDVGTVTLDGNAEEFTPSVVEAEGTSAEKDAETLRQAMRGAGTNEQSLIDIVGHRSSSQRQEIGKMYKTMFGKDLLDDLESELSGDLRELLLGLFKPPAYYDAWCLHEAMQGAGTKDSVLIEILCTRTNDQIAALAATYKESFGCDLEQDITDDTSGQFKRLLVSCCQGSRNELSPEQLQKVRDEGVDSVIDRELAQEDAQKLFDAGEAMWGTDESTFLHILAVRNYYHLQAVFEEYQKLSGKDILESIDSEMSGNLEKGLRALARVAKNRPEYFADKLHNALSGVGTKDSSLIRIITSRSEIDLQDIQEMYLVKYHKALATAVESDTSGDYKQLLLALLGNND